jgi:hypothetical protein
MDDGHANGGSLSGGKAKAGQLSAGYTWDDLVLPGSERELLRAILQKAQLRDSKVPTGVPGTLGSREPGIAVLFVGSPGTGKTMAAQIIAADLGLPVHELDLAAVSPEGEFEEIVGRAFNTAANVDAVLVIDGVGPLLSRSAVQQHDGLSPTRTRQVDRPVVPPAHERSLPWLLERSYHYPGLVIFTSTVTHALDSSLTERFDLVVNFPFPESDARREIWRKSLPDDARLTPSTLDYLATWLHWPGSTIHSCGLAAAGEAAKQGVPVELRHVAGVLEHGYRSARLPARTVLPPATRPRMEESPSRVSGGHRWRWVALGGVAIAAALGMIVAGTTASAPATKAGSKIADLGTVRVSFPSGWRRDAVPVRLSLGLTRALAIASPAPSPGVLVIGTMAAGDPSPLPQQLLATFSPTVAPELVRIDQVVLERYPSRSSFGGTIYAMPTTRGTIVAVCKSEGASSGFMGSCERVLGTMKLTTGSALRLAVSTNYGRALNSALSQLNTIRLTAGAQLAAAKTARQQAAAAARLAHAHAQAASALEHIGAGVAPIANGAVAKALVMTANAYSALALAATHNNARAYSAARAEIAHTTHALNLAFGQLRGLGYGVA